MSSSRPVSAAPGVEPDSSRLIELDGVRGFAALLVVYVHLFLTWVPAPNPVVFWIRTVSGMSWTGVVLFFALSGFLIGGNLLRIREATNYFQVFYFRRALRIFPLYYFLLGVYLLIRFGTALGGVGAFAPGIVPFWSYAALVQNFFMAVTGNWGIGALSVTWSVALEEQFYLFLPPLVRFVPVKWFVPVICGAIGCGPLFRHFINDSLFLLPGSIESLLGGVLLAWAYQNRPKIFSTRNWLLLPAGLMAIAGCGMVLIAARKNLGVFQPTVITAFWCSFLWLVVAGMGTRWTSFFRWRWLREIGKISYGVYLFHGLVAHVVFLTLAKTEDPTALGSKGIWLTVLSLVLVLGFAMVSFHGVERRLIRIGHRRSYEIPRPPKSA